MHDEIQSSLEILKEAVKIYVKHHNNQIDVTFSDKMFAEINKVKELVTEKENFLDDVDKAVNEPLISVRGNLNSRIYEIKQIELDSNNGRQYIFDTLSVLKQSLIILEYLIQFSEIHKNIVICGSNGAGKSSLISNLKKAYLQNLFVIPAEKYLYYQSSDQNLKSGEVEFNEVQQVDPNGISLSGEENDLKYRVNHNNIERNILQRFSIVLTYLINNHVSEAVKEHDDSKKVTTFFDLTRKIFKEIFPNLELSINSDTRKMFVSNNGSNKYSVEEMSDGEKASLYYIASIVTVKKHSYIVIDEPETYMNTVIFVKLWDVLQRSREDCQFIFVSHNQDFIDSRTNSVILWVRQFTYPDKWDLTQIPTGEYLTSDMTLSLVGAKIPLLLCEGEKDSYDVKIFSQLFLNDYSIVPIKGHREVIEGTKAINNLPMNQFKNKSIGIVDGDGLDNEAGSLQHNNVFVMPVNEIEMLLITDPIMNEVLSASYDNDVVEEKIKCFKKEFFKTFSNKASLDRMIINTITNKINFKLEYSFIERPREIDKLKTMWKSTSEEIESILKIDDLKEYIQKIVRDEDYESALKYCNLKQQIVPGLVNRYLDSDYANKALHALNINEDLCCEIRKKYFSKIEVK